MVMLSDLAIRSKFYRFPGENSPDQVFTNFLIIILDSHWVSLPRALERVPILGNDLDVKQKILDSCKSGNFDAVREVLARECGIPDSSLQAAKLTPMQAITKIGLLKEAFEHPFMGEAHEGLFRYLENNNKLFKSGEYSGKFCSIVQSSGTGKSRTIVELRNKGVIVLYINVRSAGEYDVFPPRDDLMAKIIETIPSSAEEYAAQISAFFAAIFRALQIAFAMLSASTPAGGTALVEAWNQQMCDIGSRGRAKFFQLVKNEYDSIKTEICRPSGTRLNNNDPTKFSIPGWKILTSEYQNWVKRSANLAMLDEGSHKPHLVIGFDSVHKLSEATSRGYRPSHILCRVISAYSQSPYPAWVLFASTSPVAEYAMPAGTALRAYVGGEELFPPYIHLGWDQHAAGIETIKPTDVSQFWHLAGLGRPLWRSLMHVEVDPEPLMEKVCAKLSMTDVYNGLSPDASLAVLGARFCLDIRQGHRESNDFHIWAVADHMRVLRSITDDQTSRTTKYPSEPILACAAAMLLHRNDHCRQNTLYELQFQIKRGLIDTGRLGDLVSRVLFLLAKDMCAQRIYPDCLHSWVIRLDDNWKAEPLYCRPVPVVEYLELMFGPSVWSNGGQDKFANWFLNFSHWISMEGRIWEKSERSPLPDRGEFIKRHWYRTSAVQCSPQQQLINQVIPIYYDDKSGSSAHRFSQILIAIEGKKSSSKSDLSYVTPQNTIGQGTSEPYVAILLNLGIHEGADANVETTYHSDSLRIYARGMTLGTFPFLESWSGTLSIFEGILASKSEIDPVIARLAAQGGVGETAGDEHVL